MFPKQHWFAFANTIIFSSAPFATVVGLVIFGMLTAPPPKKEPTTPQELVQEAETKTRQGKYEEAIALYNRAMEGMPASVELANAYWGRGAAYLQQYTRLRTRERTLKLKVRTDSTLADDYTKIAQIAAQTFVRGMADHEKAAQIAAASGFGSCATAIRETASRARDGMVRYNNAYVLYLPNGRVGC
jgi:tetratricopeptide (TPR) repeat protein